MLMRPQIDEVDYGTFMDMIEEKDVGVVEVTSTEITFTNKDNTQLYQTGAMYDPTLTERLHEAGATFDSEIGSTRLNSSHVSLSYAVFCLKKKHRNTNVNTLWRN